jgi:hypothetical protein
MSDRFESVIDPLTLRDRFAIAALRELITDKTFDRVEPWLAAELAYRYADAMIVAREAKGGGVMDKQGEVERLRDWLAAHKELWEATSGSPVDVALLVLHQLTDERTAIRQCLRDNMHLILPSWSEDKPDIVAGVEAEIADLQRQFTTATAELAKLREQVERAERHDKAIMDGDAHLLKMWARAISVNELPTDQPNPKASK